MIHTRSCENGSIIRNYDMAEPSCTPYGDIIYNEVMAETEEIAQQLGLSDIYIKHLKLSGLASGGSPRR